MRTVLFILALIFTTYGCSKVSHDSIEEIHTADNDKCDHGYGAVARLTHQVLCLHQKALTLETGKHELKIVSFAGNTITAAVGEPSNGFRIEIQADNEVENYWEIEEIKFSVYDTSKKLYILRDGKEEVKDVTNYNIYPVGDLMIYHLANQTGNPKATLAEESFHMKVEFLKHKTQKAKKEREREANAD